MLRSTILQCLALCLGLGATTALRAASPAEGRNLDRPPNIVLILTDDQGYGDVGCFGGAKIKTPRLDALAQQGTRFTDFYVPQPVCTASRAGLMTGCYPNRVGLVGALNPTSTVGIHSQEKLLPEILKEQGYTTAIVGKWHLGQQPEFHPFRHGFDAYFGLPYSNDCSNLYHPIVRTFPPLPLMDGESVSALEPDQSQFTQRFTDRAIQLINQSQDRPFFLYLAHVMPHVPIFASVSFQGRSGHGLYADVLVELDEAIGRVLDALEDRQLADNTLVIFMTDNGPWLSYGDHAGSAGPLRGGKLTVWEGGVRVPCIMRWPGKIPAGRVCQEPFLSLDLLPTIAGLARGKLPEHAIDGQDVWPVISGQPDASSPREAIAFYAGTELQAIRSGDWKLHFPHRYLEVRDPPGKDGKPAGFEFLTPESLTLSGLEGIASRHGYKVLETGLALYDLRSDISEQHNVAAEYPDVVERLSRLAESFRDELGDSLVNREGTGTRPVGQALQE